MNTYVVITPVKNEAQFIEKTIQAMVKQTLRPVEWVIVNDGSTDSTAAIVAGYAAEHAWIKLVNRADRGFRQRGQGVVEAFYTGFNELTRRDYEFVVKLDGDLSFEPTYFQDLLAEFVANPCLGIAGGGVYERLDGLNWVLQTTTDHVRGPTKVYRRACFEAIGGLSYALGWDGIDEWQALAKSWQVRSFTQFKVLHYRYTGAATGSLKSRIEQGYGAYYMGYHPLFMLVRGLRHTLRSRPYLIGGLGMIWGYVAAWMQGRDQVSDPEVIRFIRKTQLKKLAGLLVGKPVHE